MAKRLDSWHLWQRLSGVLYLFGVSNCLPTCSVHPGHSVQARRSFWSEGRTHDMIRETKLDQEIQATRIVEDANEKIWQRIKFSAIVLIVAALMIAPQFAGNYLIYVLSLWAITSI